MNRLDEYGVLGSKRYDVPLSHGKRAPLFFRRLRCFRLLLNCLWLPLFLRFFFLGLLGGHRYRAVLNAIGRLGSGTVQGSAVINGYVLNGKAEEVMYLIFIEKCIGINDADALNLLFLGDREAQVSKPVVFVKRIVQLVGALES